ncbi:L,D-transpeptidase family protein [Streptomyces resistomycificus]|uniref:Lipoprotein n=1 Tax=Streptomyces resistomycificus TaxID=67356 RepID=A0A0L8LAP6_9ACTN|nr:L,D-transpeptidase family protein [Streptomyces resistomycificus]KOG35174.1 lipoprotein [Streptomyces resistomycificus]KUN99964.1 hypothetical protein AQJ84_09785 [Streptomyces resistomycificus]
MIAPRTSIALLAASLLLTGCGSGAAAISDPRPEAAPTTSTPAPSPPPSPAVSVQAAPRQLPGLGPETLAQVPSATGQVVMATGRGKNSSRSTVVLYERAAGGWLAGEEWPAHNAYKGWTHHHRAGDLRSPVGVYDLTDAGGLLPDPGTRLPYDHGDGFTATGTGFEGEELAGAFDYVIAVNYNRQPGTSPLDWTRPLGAKRGGGIWLHVDHAGPTQGCVSIAREHMRELLQRLDPKQRPVVVMGDAESLAR